MSDTFAAGPHADLAEAWQAGNEETIGWVYQGFSAEELEAAFAAARTGKKKFEPEDIPAVTQLFTIRWVVRFLVENTLDEYGEIDDVYPMTAGAYIVVSATASWSISKA